MLGQEEKSVKEIEEDRIRKSDVGSLKIFFISVFSNAGNGKECEVMKEYEDLLNFELISNKVI